jgi:hypothetical protein
MTIRNTRYSATAAVKSTAMRLSAGSKGEPVFKVSEYDPAVNFLDISARSNLPWGKPGAVTRVSIWGSI